MLWPSRMAAGAPSATTSGTPVSQTRCARLTPPMRSQSAVMARISDCIARGARSLRVRVRFAMDSVEGMLFHITRGSAGTRRVTRTCDARHSIEGRELPQYQYVRRPLIVESRPKWRVRNEHRNEVSQCARVGDIARPRY